MLKPGGYLQWVEHDASKPHVITAPHSAPRPHLELVQAYCQSQCEPATYWISELPRLFADVGLENVLVDWRAQPGPGMVHLAYWQDVFFIAMEEPGRHESEKGLRGEMKSKGYEGGNLEIETSGIAPLLEKAHMESDHAAAIYTERIVCIGRKSGGKEPETKEDSMIKKS